MLISVVLPAPFSPIRAWISLLRTERSIPSFASTPGNRFTIPRISSSSATPIDLQDAAGRRARTPRRDRSLCEHRILELDLARFDLAADLLELGDHVGVLGDFALRLGEARIEAGQADAA